MSGLNELIARLEKASGPGREIDRAIADNILDLEWKPYSPRAKKLWGYKRGTDDVVIYDEKRVAFYTASLDAAMTLVPENHRWWVEGEEVRLDGSVDQPCAVVLPFGMDFAPSSAQYAATPAIALCIAALKALAERGS